MEKDRSYIFDRMYKEMLLFRITNKDQVLVPFAIIAMDVKNTEEKGIIMAIGDESLPDKMLCIPLVGKYYEYFIKYLELFVDTFPFYTEKSFLDSKLIQLEKEYADLFDLEIFVKEGNPNYVLVMSVRTIENNKMKFTMEWSVVKAEVEFERWDGILEEEKTIPLLKAKITGQDIDDISFYVMHAGLLYLHIKHLLNQDTKRRHLSWTALDENNHNDNHLYV